MTTHLVLGTGAVGASLAHHLAAHGHTVRAVNRSGERGALDPTIPLSQADLSDPAAAASAVAGADVVYQVTQPAYTRWGAEFPSLQRSILAAAENAGASVVLADNLYGYSAPHGATITDDSPREATTRKGRVRIAMAEEALAAHAAGKARVALTRPSNYVGANYAIYRDLVLDQIAKGKPARVLGRTDQPHSFSYVPDAARAMASIGTSDVGWGRAWITPVMAPITQAEVVTRLWDALGQQGKPKVTGMRGVALSAMALFMPMLREAVEMMYEFDEPFVASSAEFEHAFGWGATSWDDAVAEMAQAARD
ncbi:NAD-dependent epimerase/dehydratase family protein [Demequina sp.]|uniref:NAD-dependent epimerase/dehydratase family protein n=1 Tax=Demequina sp. TaxID=2050685 RepID=UPI0025BAF7EF|nr:NAD-dependent epimerase/dehydratase family protein [Demequina sp.]